MRITKREIKKLSAEAVRAAAGTDGQLYGMRFGSDIGGGARYISGEENRIFLGRTGAREAAAYLTAIIGEFKTVGYTPSAMFFDVVNELKANSDTPKIKRAWSAGKACGRSRVWAKRDAIVKDGRYSVDVEFCGAQQNAEGLPSGQAWVARFGPTTHNREWIGAYTTEEAAINAAVWFEILRWMSYEGDPTLNATEQAHATAGLCTMQTAYSAPGVEYCQNKRDPLNMYHCKRHARELAEQQG